MGKMWRSRPITMAPSGLVLSHSGGASGMAGFPIVSKHRRSSSIAQPYTMCNRQSFQVLPKDAIKKKSTLDPIEKIHFCQFPLSCDNAPSPPHAARSHGNGFSGFQGRGGKSCFHAQKFSTAIAMDRAAATLNVMVIPLHGQILRGRKLPPPRFSWSICVDFSTGARTSQQNPLCLF